MVKSLFSGIGKAHWAVKALLILFAAILLLALVTGINTQHFSPFTLNRKLVSPFAIAGNERRTVIIDDFRKDILFCDENNRLFRIVDLSKSGSPAERAGDVYILGDFVYVLATNQVSGGVYIKNEYVLKFDLDGNYIAAVYERNYPDDEYHELTTVRAMSDDGEKLLLATVDERGMSVIRIDTESGKEPEVLKTIELDDQFANVLFLPGTQDIVYFLENTYEDMLEQKGEAGTAAENRGDDENRINLDNPRGRVEGFKLESGEKITDIDPYLEKYNEIIALMGAQGYYYFDDSTMSFITVVPIKIGTDTESGMYYVTDLLGKKVFMYDSRTGQMDEIVSLPLHPLLFAGNLLFWAAAVVFGLLLLLFIIDVIRKKWNKNTRIFLLALVVLLAMTAFFSEREKNGIVRQYKVNLMTTAKLAAGSVSGIYQNWQMINGIDSARTSDTGNSVPENDAVIRMIAAAEEIDETLKFICHSQDKENGCYVQVFMIGPDRRVFYVSDSLGLAHFGNVIGEWNDIEQPLLGYIGNTVIEDGVFSKVIDTCRLITDVEGNPVGFIEVGSDLGNLYATLNEREFNLMLELLALLIVLFVLFRVAFTFRGDLTLYRKQRAAGEQDCVIALNGMYSFMHSISTRLDSVILPLLAIRLCQNMSAEQAAIMAVIPITAKSVGIWLGEFAFAPMTKRLGERRCAIISPILCIMFCLAEAWCVFQSNIYLFSAAKLGFSVFGSVMYSFRRTIPLGAKNNEVRKRAIFSDTQGAIAATILSILLGGYLTQNVSDVMLYIVGAVLLVPLLLLCMFIFPARKRENAAAALTGNAGSKRGKSVISVLLSPAIPILLVSVWLPYIIMNGYMGYLFPLYAKSVGTSEIILSSINVFAMAFGFALSGPVSEAVSRYRRDKVTVALILLPCFCLILSVLSRNILWATFCLFAFALVQKQIPVNFGIEVAEAIPEKYDKKSARHCVSITQEGLETVTKPALSVLVPFGHFIGSAILGAVCAALAGARMIFERLRKKK